MTSTPTTALSNDVKTSDKHTETKYYMKAQYDAALKLTKNLATLPRDKQPVELDRTIEISADSKQTVHYYPKMELDRALAISVNLNSIDPALVPVEYTGPVETVSTVVGKSDAAAASNFKILATTATDAVAANLNVYDVELHTDLEPDDLQAILLMARSRRFRLVSVIVGERDALQKAKFMDVILQLLVKDFPWFIIDTKPLRKYIASGSKLVYPNELKPVADVKAVAPFDEKTWSPWSNTSSYWEAFDVSVPNPMLVLLKPVHELIVKQPPKMLHTTVLFAANAFNIGSATRKQTDKQQQLLLSFANFKECYFFGSVPSLQKPLDSAIGNSIENTRSGRYFTALENAGKSSESVRRLGLGAIECWNRHLYAEMMQELKSEYKDAFDHEHETIFSLLSSDHKSGGDLVLERVKKSSVPEWCTINWKVSWAISRHFDRQTVAADQCLVAAFLDSVNVDSKSDKPLAQYLRRNQTAYFTDKHYIAYRDESSSSLPSGSPIQSRIHVWHGIPFDMMVDSLTRLFL